MKEKKFLTSTKNFISLVFTFDMSVNDGTNSQESESVIDDDDLLYTAAGKLLVTVLDVAEVVAL